MSTIRPPVAAGVFYPAHADELAETVDGLLAAAAPQELAGPVRALVAPHAGYVYSGPTAAAAFATLPPANGSFRVVLLGPSHHVPLAGAAVTSAEGWETPLGIVGVDGDLREAAIDAGAVIDDRPHRDDHALEVELPFLQRRCGGQLSVLPLAIGADAPSVEIAAALASADLLVVSSDLSHFHDEATAHRLDRRTAEAVLALDDAAVDDFDACGVYALRALLRHARGSGWTATLLDLRTSADASGDTRRVVGYGAFAFAARRTSG